MAYETTIYTIIILSFLIIGGLFLYLTMQYKCKIVFKEVTNGRKLIRFHRAKEYTDKSGVNWWKISGERRKTHKIIPAPPDPAIEIDAKGKKWAQCLIGQSGVPQWLKDTSELREIPEEIRKDKDKVLQWLKENEISDGFEPFTTKQRLIYVHNLKKAEQRKGFSWKENLPQMVAIGALVLIVAVLVFGFGEIAQPILRANSQAASIEVERTQQLEILREIKTGQQRIEDEISDINNQGAPN